MEQQYLTTDSMCKALEVLNWGQDEFEDEVGKMLAKRIQEKKTERRRKSRNAWISTDSGFEEYVNGFECLHGYPNSAGMIVHKSCYKYVSKCCHIDGMEYHIDDPPVIMKGSRYACHKRYSLTRYGDHPRGWVRKIFRRYCQMWKITILTRQDAAKVSLKFKEKYGWDAADRAEFMPMIESKWNGNIKSAWCMVNGETVDMTRSQMIQVEALKKKVERFEKLENAGKKKPRKTEADSYI